MKLKRDDLEKLVGWYRKYKPEIDHVTVDTTEEGVRKHCREMNGKFYFQEMEIRRRGA